MCLWGFILLEPFEPVVLKFVAYYLWVYLVVGAFAEILLDSVCDCVSAISANGWYKIVKAGFEILLTFLTNSFQNPTAFLIVLTHTKIIPIRMP